MKTGFLRAGVLAALILAAAGTNPAAAQATKNADDGQVEYCGLCEAKKRFHQAAPWIEVGADLRLRMIYDQAVTSLDKDSRGHDRFWQRFRARVWGKFTPIENVDVNVRLVTEPRNYCRPDTMSDQFIREEVLFDQLNVKWSKMFGLPMAATVGRQDIRLGEGWLVLEGTPLDGSRTIFFDAARLTYDKTQADLIYIENHANSSYYIKPFNDDHVDLVEQDERGAILYLSNKSLEKTQIDGYFIWKHDSGARSRNARATEGDLYTFGVLVKGDLTDHWKYYAEAAPQFGHKNGYDISAFGLNSKLSYLFKDPMKNGLHLMYEYLSGGEHPAENFDRLWGRYPQWSEVYNGYVDSIEDKPAESSNLHRVGLGWSVEPTKKLEMLTSYSLLFADDNYAKGTATGLSDSGCFRGQVGSWLLKYTINEHVKGHLLGEVFGPGDFYTDSRNDVATFLRFEIVFSW